VTAEDIKTVFSSSAVILNYSSQLLEELNERLRHWDSKSTKIGDVFLKMSAFLKTYQSYITNYASAIRTLQKLQKNPEFKNFLLELQMDPRSKGYELTSFLIMPIQRIPRYTLLLQQLMKNTPQTHTDYHDLVEAIKKIEEVTNVLNESERQAENMNKIFKIQEKLDGDYHDLLQPHRRLCKEGTLFLVKQKEVKTDRYFYLFNDVLLHVKLSRKYLEKQKRNSTSQVEVNPNDLTATVAPRLVYKEHIELTNVALSELEGNRFALVHAQDWTKQLIVLEAKTQTEKQEWVKAIDDCITETGQKKRFFEENIKKVEKRRTSGQQL